MCDYSLYTIQNRLAEEGEQLVLHKFTTGTLGFASVSDLAHHVTTSWKEPRGFLSAITAWLCYGRSEQVPAVCIPPGTRLLLGDVPMPIQSSLCLGPSEIVVFTEISSRSYSYRGALLLPNGTRVLLQDLPEGIHATVLSTSSETSAKPVTADVCAA